MHKGMFTEEELRHLRSLDAVERAEPPRITYSKEFEREFMRRHHEGERPRAIFESAGLKAELIGYKRIERACAHWREAETKDAPCLTDDKNPTRDDIRARERGRASERCAAIRASRDRRVAEMEERFEVIFRLRTDDPAFNVSAACEALEVSRRGYCDRMAAAPGREKADLEAKEQAEAAYGYRGLKKGSRQVVDCLRRRQGVVMNRKKVQRIARKYDLAPKRKKKNPCHPIGTDGLPKVAANVVNRQFRRGRPLKVISTDIAKPTSYWPT